MNFREQLLSNEALLSTFIYERGEVIRMAYVALLAREHVLWLGLPGTAKSMLARLMAQQFGDAVYREYLFSRQSTEADVFAHKSIPELMEGREAWLLEGHLSEGHIVFADEIFKSSGSTLNCGLGFLNERIVKGHQVPLITCFAASNELAGDEGLEALRDRFVISHVFESLSNAETRAAFLFDRIAQRKAPELQRLALADLFSAQEEALRVPVDDTIVDNVLRLQSTLTEAGCFVSDRTIGKSINILRAFAWLDGSDRVDLEHLHCLGHVFWNEPEQIASVVAAIATIDKGILGDVREITDRALKNYRNFRRSVLPDGTWSDASARKLYVSRLPDLKHSLHQAAELITHKYGGRLQGDMKERVKRYLNDLMVAYKQVVLDIDKSSRLVS